MAENDKSKVDGKFIQECLQKREDVYKKAVECRKLAMESQKAAEKLFEEIQRLKQEIAQRDKDYATLANGPGKYRYKEETDKKRAELKNLQTALKKQNAITRGYNTARRGYEQSSRSYGVAVREAQKQMKEDSEKANAQKQREKRVAAAKQRVADMRAAVKKKAEELGKDVKMEELRDSRGNRIFTFQDKDGKYIGVMSAKRGKPLGEYIDATKSAELQALCQDAKDMSKNKKANLAQMIDIIDNRAKLEAEIAKGKENKDRSSEKSMSLADLQKFAKPMTVQEIEASLKKSKEIKALETKDVPKSVKTPEVRLIPKKRRNGEDSKRRFEAIELMDANGNTFRLTKKMMKEAVKQQGNSAASRSEMVDYSWDNYVEAAKKGQLKPETVASFFKGQANMGETQVDETTKSTAIPSINATLAVDNKMEDTVKAADQTINRIGIMRYRNNQRGG